jgi:hypothetical protein
MTGDFHEDFVSEKIDPLADTHADFPFDEIDSEIAGLDEENRAKLCQAYRRIFQWFCNINLKSDTAPVMISRRVLALAWVLDPSLIEGSPSAAELARKIGCPRTKFHGLTGSVVRKFGIRNRAQAHAWNRGKKEEVSSVSG